MPDSDNETTDNETTDLIVLRDGQLLPLDLQEEGHLKQASELFQAGFYEPALLYLWVAAVSNLRRRVEAYSLDLFGSVADELPGRCRLKPDGETLNERWAGVDDAVLLEGCRRLGLITKKAAKLLELVNWMRNHASPAHPNEDGVGRDEVIHMARMLQKNLFELPLPEPGHSVAGLFTPVKTESLRPTELEVLQDQVRAYKQPDLRACFGFVLDLIDVGEEPGYANALALWPTVWEAAGTDLRNIAGMKYHDRFFERSTDAHTRLLEALVLVSGVQHIPEGARARLFRRAAQAMAQAKDASYGWKDEEAAAQTLAQFGPHVPSIAFEEVYREILAVWFGNRWSRSGAHVALRPFIDALQTNQLLPIIEMIRANDRVREEFFSKNPRQRARKLLDEIGERLTLAAHKRLAETAKESVKAIY